MMSKHESLISFDRWKSLREAEVVAGLGPKKNKDGQGYWWAGDIAGGGTTSISGEVETVKSDPDGTKGIKHGRKGKKRS